MFAIRTRRRPKSTRRKWQSDQFSQMQKFQGSWVLFWNTRLTLPNRFRPNCSSHSIWKNRLGKVSSKRPGWLVYSSLNKLFLFFKFNPFQSISQTTGISIAMMQWFCWPIRFIDAKKMCSCFRLVMKAGNCASSAECRGRTWRWQKLTVQKNAYVSNYIANKEYYKICLFEKYFASNLTDAPIF